MSLAVLDDTPLTERYFDTTLWRLLVRLAPEIDMTRHTPTRGQMALLDVLGTAPPSLGVQESTWAGFTVLAHAIEATGDLTDGECLFVTITKLRQLLLSGTPDREGDTVMGQAFLLVLAVGLLAGRVFGEDAAEIMALRSVAETALKAREGRADHAKALNASKTAWHTPALDRAREWREKYPYRSDAKLADMIMGDAKLSPAPPSTTAVIEAMAKWRRGGQLAARRRAGT